MQTWVVHMRSPLRLARELGLPGFAVFQLLADGTVLAALPHVLFAARLMWILALAPMDNAMTRVLVGFDAVTPGGRLSDLGFLGLIGLARRRRLGCAWVLLLIPLYWLLLSLAAWRALFQLLRDPYRWEKTEHGLARTSRRAVTVQR